MSARSARLFVAASSLALAAAACLAGDDPAHLTAAAAGPVVGNVPAHEFTGPQGVIRHVLILVQENRTPDNLFHGLPGADIADHGFDSKGHYVELRPVDLTGPYDLSHRHQDFVLEYDNGRMDGFDQEPANCKGSKSCAPQDAAFMYVPQDQVPADKRGELK